LGCTPAGTLELDPSEELRVWAVPWLEWQELMRAGKIHHALVLAAFLRLTCWNGWDNLKKSLENL
jgi:ADP-ribose pyrophosphatase